MSDSSNTPRAVAPTQADDGTIGTVIGALRDFWHLAGPYWRSSGRGYAVLLTIALGIATLANALLQLGVNTWFGGFFNAIDAHDSRSVLHYVFVFIALAAGLMVVAATQIRIKASLQIGWRQWITDRLVNHWLEHGHNFMLSFRADEYDNPDHRIGEDVRMVTEAAVDFAAGLINSALLLLIFIGALWSLSGLVHLPLGPVSIPIPGYLVAAAILYAAISTILTHWLGKPLVRLSEERHAREGDFRFSLVRVRENAEGAALLRGETVERAGLQRVFDHLIRAFQAQMNLETKLTLATTCFTVANPVVPLLIAAPQFLAGNISLGELMQISQAFVQVQLALGFFVDNYMRLSDWMAGINRIVRLDLACAAHDIDKDDGSSRIEIKEGPDDVLRLVDLTLASADGDVMIDGATVAIVAGEKVLVQGDVGVGKTTLFRALAGLWPWGSGRIETPPYRQMMFVSHRPYVPTGSLKAALAYPKAADDIADSAAREALARCGLGRFADKLGTDARWDQVLAEAEQQRLAFARLLLHRPRWVVMDEATSELDPAAEADLMAIFRAELAGTTVITIAQRESLKSFHDRTLTLVLTAYGAHLVKAGATPFDRVKSLG